jgi:hypothetical protein
MATRGFGPFGTDSRARIGPVPLRRKVSRETIGCIQYSIELIGSRLFHVDDT